MYFLYFILLIFILLILFKAYIKIRYKFWAYQPVFHSYNLLYRIYSQGIINKELPEVNKYSNFLNIITTDFVERDENNIKKVVEFLGEYYHNKGIKYLPTVETFSSYFIGNNSKTFISTYYQITTIINKDDIPIPSQIPEILGIITSRPLTITFKNINSIRIYYIDYLCVHNEHKKENIESELFQTHEYIQCHKTKKSQISLFKREGNLPGVVPLIVYKTYQYVISSMPKYTLPHASMKLIEINKLNIRLLIIFIYNQKEKLDCFVLPDIPNLINLINNNIYKIYAIIQNDILLACYFFRDSNLYYTDNSYHIKGFDCFASITNCDDKIFMEGFSIALHKCSKSLKAKIITIENISHNNIIINYLFLLNIIPRIVNHMTYYLYNYIKKTILSKNTFIIC